VRSRRRHVRVVLRSNFYNLHVIDSLHDDQKVEVPLTVWCLNAQSLRNKAISVADYVVLQGIDLLALTETWLGTDTDQMAAAVVVLVYCTNSGLTITVSQRQPICRLILLIWSVS